ncbi:MAG: TetR/AcrR family transcriptional regulator [Promethearchaeota archaeon]|nr:MAG: TetR/AcrR family transcriptional regulator [Candidatus Lokiarchaeota archaeon]
MKKQGARDLIIQTANRLVDKNGYANTNIIEIAKKADISVGTLYYHFPKGKIDILLTLTREITQDFKREAKRLGFREEMDFSTIKEALTYYLSLIIKLHKKYRLTMAAWESEILSNLDYYLKLREKRNLEKEFSDEMNIFINEIERVIKKFPEENLIFEGKEKQLYIITQAIIHKYTYDSYGFDSDEEIVDILLKIILTLLRD